MQHTLEQRLCCEATSEVRLFPSSVLQIPLSKQHTSFLPVIVYLSPQPYGSGATVTMCI